jgi:hypothetical protein
MYKTIFYTGPYVNGMRPHKFMRFLTEYYYKKRMCSGCGKVFNESFLKLGVKS